MLHKFLYMHTNTHAEFLCSQSIRRLCSLLWSVIPPAASIVLSCRTGTFMSLWRNTTPLSTALKQGTINNSLLLLSTGVSKWYSCIFCKNPPNYVEYWCSITYYLIVLILQDCFGSGKPERLVHIYWSGCDMGSVRPSVFHDVSNQANSKGITCTVHKLGVLVCFFKCWNLWAGSKPGK